MMDSGSKLASTSAPVATGANGAALAETATFTITELANAFRCTPRAIRFYEDKGLLQPHRQGLSRVYSRRDRARLALILRGKRLGFSLAEIREMIDLYDLGDGQVEQLRVTLKRVKDRIESLERQRQDIIDALEELHLSEKLIGEFLVRRQQGAGRANFKEYMTDCGITPRQLLETTINGRIAGKG